MENTNKLGGWLLFMAVTKWITILTVGLMTIGIVATYAGTVADISLFEILVCGLVCCAAQFLEFRALAMKQFLGNRINNKEDILIAFAKTEGVSTIAMCIFMNIYAGTWITMLLSQLSYCALWGIYLYKSKRVDEWF